jgi:hypothetical protein
VVTGRHKHVAHEDPNSGIRLVEVGASASEGHNKGYCESPGDSKGAYSSGGGSGLDGGAHNTGAGTSSVSRQSSEERSDEELDATAKVLKPHVSPSPSSTRHHGTLYAD